MAKKLILHLWIWYIERLKHTKTDNVWNNENLAQETVQFVWPIKGGKKVRKCVI